MIAGFFREQNVGVEAGLSNKQMGSKIGGTPIGGENVMNNKRRVMALITYISRDNMP